MITQPVSEQHRYLHPHYQLPAMCSALPPPVSTKHRQGGAAESAVGAERHGGFSTLCGGESQKLAVLRRSTTISSRGAALLYGRTWQSVSAMSTPELAALAKRTGLARNTVKKHYGMMAGMLGGSTTDKLCCPKLCGFRLSVTVPFPFDGQLPMISILP